MGISDDKIPSKTDLGMKYIVTPKSFTNLNINKNHRRLLIIIDGKKSISDLVNSGLSEVGIETIQELIDFGLIRINNDIPTLTNLINKE